jgi:hypothetical protein
MKSNISKIANFVGSILLLSIFFSILLYKTFCTLDQVIDWNAISSISNIIMSFLTLIAVLIAIIIPIEDRYISSRLDLFDQRFDAYMKLRDTLEEIYLKETYSNSEEMKIILSKCSFIICKADYHSILEICKNIQVINKQMKTKKSPKSIDDIKDELNKLKDVFYKYLAINNFGIDDK